MSFLKKATPTGGLIAAVSQVQKAQIDAEVKIDSTGTVSVETGIQKTEAELPVQNTESAGTAVVVAKPFGLLASVAKASQRIEAKAVDTDYLFDEEPKDFRSILDRFDQLIKRDSGIDDFNVDTCRAYVKRIYTDLDTQPELAGLMIPGDTANVIHFIRIMRERALDSGVKKVEKAAKKATTAKGVNRFSDKALQLDLNSLPATLGELSDSESWDV